MDDAKIPQSFQVVERQFCSRLAAFRKDREKRTSMSLKRISIMWLQRWGIASPENLGEVVICLYARLAILAASPLMYGIIALFLRTFNSLIVFGLLAVPCLFGVLATAWRIWVLKNTRFCALHALVVWRLWDLAMRGRLCLCLFDFQFRRFAMVKNYSSFTHLSFCLWMRS